MPIALFLHRSGSTSESSVSSNTEPKKTDNLALKKGKDQTAELYIQTNEGLFERTFQGVFENDRGHEDTAAIFLDFDNDNGDLSTVSTMVRFILESLSFF